MSKLRKLDFLPSIWSVGTLKFHYNFLESGSSKKKINIFFRSFGYHKNILAWKIFTFFQGLDKPNEKDRQCLTYEPTLFYSLKSHLKTRCLSLVEEIDYLQRIVEKKCLIGCFFNNCHFDLKFKHAASTILSFNKVFLLCEFYTLF